MPAAVGNSWPMAYQGSFGSQCQAPIPGSADASSAAGLSHLFACPRTIGRGWQVLDDEHPVPSVAFSGQIWLFAGCILAARSQPLDTTTSVPPLPDSRTRLWLISGFVLVRLRARCWLLNLRFSLLLGSWRRSATRGCSQQTSFCDSWVASSTRPLSGLACISRF